MSEQVARAGSRRRLVRATGRRFARKLVTTSMHRAGRLPIHEARAEHASVLDGATLRVLGLYRPLRARPVSDLELCLRRRGGETVRLCALDVERRASGGVRFEANAALVAPGREARIAAGLWDAFLREPGRRMVPVRAPRPLRDTGPTVANPRSPVDGVQYRPRRTAWGQLCLKVLDFPAHVEVEEVRVEAGELVIEGRVVGVAVPSADGDDAPAVLELSEMGTGRVAHGRALRSRDHVTASFAAAQFVDRGGQPCTWHVALRTPRSQEPLAVGRFLDDLRDPAAVYRHPCVVVGTGSEGATCVQLTYAADRRLVLRCSAAGEGARP